MKEKELREKMAGLYGGVPADTHAAFEHALTHHREEQERRPARMSKPRFAVLLALMLALLATGAYAVYSRYSVMDYMGNRSQAFRDHIITLDERYQNDLFTMTINDVVFDGETFAVAMNILRHSEDIVYYIHANVTAVCDGKAYWIDPEGTSGPDFIAGGLWPDFSDFYDDPTMIEQRGFGFEGVLWDEDMNPPPAGEPVEWTITFQVFTPLWEIIADNELHPLESYDTLRERQIEAWRNQQILIYSGDTNGYIMAVTNELNRPGVLSAEGLQEEMAATGAFELADIITFHFTSNFDDRVIREEMVGQRYELGEYAVVIDSLEASIQRIHARMHIDFGREMSLEELEAARVPSYLAVEVAGSSKPTYANTSINHYTGEYDISFEVWHDAGEVTAITLRGYDLDPVTRERIYWDDFVFTMELP